MRSRQQSQATWFWSQLLGLVVCGRRWLQSKAGKDLAVASKEILVMAGEIVMREAREKGVQVLPVDSEHNAIFQCLQSGRAL